MPEYEGLIAAPFTAMHPDGSVNLPLVAEQAAGLVADGVRGAFICGTTGEGLSLTTAERRSLAEAWREATPGSFDLYVHVGHPVVAEAAALAEHAASIGADAVAAMPASPFASSRIADVTEYLRIVARAAPDLPLLYYHIPSFSRIAVSVRDLLAYAGPLVPNLAGAKFTHEDLMDYQRSAALDGGRYRILFGRDELYLAGLACGARGAVGSTYNFAAPLFHRLTAAFEQGDWECARRHQGALQEVVAVLTRFPGLAAQKHAMRRVGQDLGPVRAPARALSSADVDELDKALDAIDFAAVCRAQEADDGGDGQAGRS